MNKICYLLCFIFFACQPNELLQPPVSYAGDDIETLTYTPVILDGSKSNSNIPGDSLRFYWSVVSAPSTGIPTLGNPASRKTNFIANLPGIYHVALQVTDRENQSDMDTLVVNVIGRFIFLDNLTVNPTPSQGNVVIKAISNVQWSAVGNVEWITINPVVGTPPSTAITITWSYNPNLTSRQGSVTFSSPHTVDAVFQINQQEPTLGVNINKIEAAAEMGSKTVTVNSNTNWVSYVLNGNQWLSLANVPNGFTVNWTKNSTGFVRYGTIQVMGPETWVYNIEVIQSN